jgi:YjbR protein
LAKNNKVPLDATDFRRIALGLAGAEEGSHMSQPDFRVGGRIFATLASAKQGYGNLMLTRDQQQAFVEEAPEIFVPIKGGWGRMGMTHIKLDEADEDVLYGALHTAWTLRVAKNAKSGRKYSPRIARAEATKKRRKKQ